MSFQYGDGWKSASCNDCGRVFQPNPILQVECPREGCRANIGERCHSDQGRPSEFPHATREEDAIEIITGPCPEHNLWQQSVVADASERVWTVPCPACQRPARLVVPCEHCQVESPELHVRIETVKRWVRESARLASLLEEG